MIDVSDILADPDFLETITLIRAPFGASLADGVWSQPATITKSFKGGIQDPGDSPWVSLPEGVRIQDATLIYTRFELRGETVDAAGRSMPGDIIVFAGMRFKVVSMRDGWAHRGYLCFLAVKLERGR